MFLHRTPRTAAGRGQAPPQHPPGAPASHPVRQCRPLAAAASSGGEAGASSTPAPPLTSDPEAPLRRYGSFFGKNFQLPSWLDEVPRVRVRTIAQRQVNDLVELAVLNERLSGETEPWEARSRLELLRKKRRNWEHIYNYVTKADAALTLELIEEANQQAELLLSEEAQERASVSDLKLQLQDLQQQVDEASQRLQATQARVDSNLEHVAALKAEAAALERLQASTPVAAAAAASTSVASSSSSSSSSLATSGMSAASASVATATASVAGRVASSPSSSPSSSGVATKPAPPSSSGARRGSSSSSSPSSSSRRDSSRRPDRGLRSSLEAEPALKEFWYPAEFSSQLAADMLVPFELFDEPWVLFRDAEGRPSCIRDECAHRACPLSLGQMVDGKVSCAYHGWEFDGDGSCTKMPSTVLCRNVSVAALPCVEKDGFIWVWPGEGVPPEAPDTTRPPAGYEIHAEIKLEVPVEHGLLIENLLDLAHAPFTHQSTFARGWPVPDAVKFHANQLLWGQWDPYPIDMGFQPPCMTVSKIGLAQPGQIMRGTTADNCERHLHQLHVCAPGRKGTTRLLYRMSMDFLGWVRHVPGILELWKGVAGQVLGEDLKLVLGQQDRLERGSDTWANPVSYDKLGVRYRRWRNGVASGRLPDGTTGQGSSREAAIRMSAGQLFSLDEDDEGFLDQQQQQQDRRLLQQQQEEEQGEEAQA